jgi:hypothetical protein
MAGRASEMGLQQMLNRMTSQTGKRGKPKASRSHFFLTIVSEGAMASAVHAHRQATGIGDLIK